MLRFRTSASRPCTSSGPKRNRRRGAVYLALVLTVFGGVNPGQALDLAAATRHEAEAKKLAGEEFKNVAMLCRPSEEQGAFLHKLPDPPTPQRMFDNFYFLGFGEVTAFAINTSAGIFIIDALESPEQIDKYVIGGLK